MYGVVMSQFLDIDFYASCFAASTLDGVLLYYVIDFFFFLIFCNLYIITSGFNSHRNMPPPSELRIGDNVVSKKIKSTLHSKSSSTTGDE